MQPRVLLDGLAMPVHTARLSVSPRSGRRLASVADRAARLAPGPGSTSTSLAWIGSPQWAQRSSACVRCPRGGGGGARAGRPRLPSSGRPRR